MFLDNSRSTMEQQLNDLRSSVEREMERLPFEITENDIVIKYVMWRALLDVIDFFLYYGTKNANKVLICRTKKDKILNQMELTNAVEEAITFLSKQWPTGNRVFDLRNQTTLMTLNQIYSKRN